MKICILTNEMLQIGMASASRTRAYAKALALAGDEVTVYSPFGFPNAISSEIDKEEILSGGVPYRYFTYLKKHPKEGRNFLSAALLFFLFRQLGYLKLYSKLAFSRQSYDVVFVYEFPIWHSFWIRMFSLGKPLVYELCEIPFPLEYPKQLLHRRCRERFNFRFADGFIAISDNLYFYAKNLKRKFKLLKVPILVDEPEIEENLTGIDIQSPSIVHIGSLHPTKDFIKYMMEAYGKAMAQLIEEKKFHFYLSGELKNAPDADEIESLIAKYNLSEWVHFIGYQKEKNLYGLIKNCQLAVVYKDHNEINHYGFPTKIGAYFRAGIPIVISPVGEMQKYVQHGKNGFVVGLQDNDALANTLIAFFNQPELFATMSANALATAKEHFSIPKQGERISTFFKEELLN